MINGKKLNVVIHPKQEQEDNTLFRYKERTITNTKGKFSGHPFQSNSLFYSPDVLKKKNKKALCIIGAILCHQFS